MCDMAQYPLESSLPDFPVSHTTISTIEMLTCLWKIKQLYKNLLPMPKLYTPAEYILLKIESAYRRCHKKTSYVSNYVFLTLLHE